MKRFSDKFLYWTLLFAALIFFLASLYLLFWNTQRLDLGYTTLVTQCAPTQNYLCAVNVISDYNLAYSTYYHVLTGVLCLSAILASAIVTFVLQNKHSHYKDFLKD